MEKYEVIRLVGEGSFGRVFQAKQKIDLRTVALKVISKRGRSLKELIGLRRECEIQRHLHHPNIIQMLDSFETEDEIYVITEFAHKELYVILGKEGYLPETRVRTIVWDLVSALYYLHSHRVLHRDLKPQNILLDVNDCAKLCDFGFARNMSTGTHVLTSIKGTPLYMAPELIEEHPYDHNADLWSLGCIIYELLVGAPPFCTTSILHLVRLIRHEEVQWPNFISDICISFLRGLLQKDPTKRLTWPEILKHPFVEGHVIITDEANSIPLTKPLPPSELEAKERQFQDLSHKSANQSNARAVSPIETEEATGDQNISQLDDFDKCCTLETENIKLDEANSNYSKLSTETHMDTTVKSDNYDYVSNGDKSCELKNGSSTKLTENVEKKLYNSENFNSQSSCDRNKATDSSKISMDQNNMKGDHITSNDMKGSLDSNRDTPTKINCLQNWNWTEDTQPIECEEWEAFLEKSMHEIMAGELTSLCQANLAAIIIAPLRNSNTSYKVLEYIACLLCLPFVIPDVSDEVLTKIRDVYLEIKLLPNLIFASKLLVRNKDPINTSSSETTPTPTNSPIPTIQQTASEIYRSMSDLSVDELLTLEYMYLLICRLIFIEDQFIHQFCDAVSILNVTSLFQQFLLLTKRKIKLVTDIIAILMQIMNKCPNNTELVEKILFCQSEMAAAKPDTQIDIVYLLRHSNSLLRSRVCFILCLLSKYSSKVLQNTWNLRLQETLEALVYDSIENVRNAAEIAVDELKQQTFYIREKVTE